jgi:NAD(P)H-flavin reductase
MTLADPMQPEAARVLARHEECAGVITLTLATAARPIQPGQFNMLYAFGVGEVPISTSGDPAHAGVAVHTIREVGAATRALCRTRPDDVIGIRGPFGTPWPLDALAGADLLVIAGGLGLAPLRPVVYHALARRSAFGRVRLLMGARSPSDLLFRAELERWQHQELEVLVTVDHADPSWEGHVGVVPALLAGLDLRPSTAALLCGPEVMMRFTVRELGRRGVAEDRMFLAMERNMKCAVGFCGHCQLGPSFVCKDGPVLRCDRLGSWLWLKEG